MRRPLLVRGTATFARNFTLFLRGHRCESPALLAFPVHDPTFCGVIHSGTLPVTAGPPAPQHDHRGTPGVGWRILDGSWFRLVGRCIRRTRRIVPVVASGKRRVFVFVVRLLHARSLSTLFLPPGCSIKPYATQTVMRTAELARKSLKMRRYLRNRYTHAPHWNDSLHPTLHMRLLHRAIGRLRWSDQRETFQSFVAE